MLYYVYTDTVGSTDLAFKTERWFVVTESITVHVSSVCVWKSLYHSDLEKKDFCFIAM